jgi:lipopolysaccharide transport system permease protein
MTMLSYTRELYHYRDLLRMWSLREIKVRYKQSLLGAAWAILQPLVLMLMFTAVFAVIARVPSDGIPYPLFSYAALLPWTFFSTGISFAVPSLVNNMGLVTKIYFPREVLPLGAVIAAFVDFTVASTIFVALLVLYVVPLHLTLLWVPALVATQVILTLGVVFFASTFNVWYRDIRFVVPLGLQLWLYASPIIYPVSLVPERWRAPYMLNPMASLMDSYRRVILLGQPPQYAYLLWAVLLSATLCVSGYAYFKRSEPRFADVI